MLKTRPAEAEFPFGGQMALCVGCIGQGWGSWEAVWWLLGSKLVKVVVYSEDRLEKPSSFQTHRIQIGDGLARKSKSF